MILSIVSFLMNITSIVFVLYKSINHIALSKNTDLSADTTSYLVTSWILFLVFSSLKCCCAGFLGSLWNLLASAGLVFCLLNTKTVNKKLFQENTFENIVLVGKQLVEKYLPKKKAQ